ncbi:kinase-like domain-containing protein [Xylariaceae sp. FL0804]|nr:kinase-like domain-containing protein [Xylariaceae sp. FL0804]
MFRQEAPRLSFQRVLGFGGFGIVQHWTQNDSSGNPMQELAVKTCFHPREDHRQEFRREITWMKLFQSANHFVQLINLGNATLASEIYNNPRAPQPMIIMEYLKRTDLEELLNTINEAKGTNFRFPADQRKIEYIPSRLLWKIFLCLVRACIGLEYPPPPIPEPDDPNATPERVHWREVIDGDREPRCIVHHDIHPKNVCIGDPDLGRAQAEYDAEHYFNPALKLCDFGLTKEWHPNMSMARKRAYTNYGRPAWKAPETGSNRWMDNMACGSFTNIYGAGMIMFNCMTLSFPAEYPQTCAIQQDDGTYRYLTTYGFHLVGPYQGTGNAPEPQVDERFRNYDRNLRLLIARCLADDPDDRPDLHELIWEVEEGFTVTDDMASEASAGPFDIQRPQPVETEHDDLLWKFYQDYFFNAPNITDPYAGEWDQYSNPIAQIVSEISSGFHGIGLN